MPNTYPRDGILEFSIRTSQHIPFITDETLFSRERRGLNRAEIGQAAIRYLLQGARYIREQRGYSLYTKKGKYRDALKDFNSLNPSGLRQRQTHGGNEKLLVGAVGDRKIQLLTDKDGKYGMGLSTILLVSNPKKGELPYKIVYKNKF